MARILFSSLEPLEARIAPAALTAPNPLPDIVAGLGKTGATVDLGHMFGEAGSYRTQVEFTTNFDTDPNAPGIQAGKIVIELFDDKAPLTVQNFLGYVNNRTAKGDYDGTIFHRSVYVDSNNDGTAETPFVLQGGGFAATNLTAHIPTSQPVHNEFNEYGGTPVSNLRGTVALAKTALGPNTGTSEFFFNLSDNSQNLDQQNGGFTVFGRVIQGMDVVDAIAALQAWSFGNLNGNTALSDVPAQGYHPDPDSNSSTPSPLPTGSQLIQITEAKVIPATDAQSANTSYSVTITDGNGNPSNVVTGKLTGDTLQLAYKPGSSGTAKVVVSAQRGDDVVTDEFDVVVKPNLIASSGGDTLPDIIVPGNKGTAKVTLANSGAAAMNGKVDVKFYLSEITEQDPNGTIVDSSDVQIGAISGKALKLASGKSITLSSKVVVPQTLELDSGKQYRVISEVVIPDGAPKVELFEDDNSTVDGRAHVFVNGNGSNLVAYAADNSLLSIAVPGDKGVGKVLLYNNTGQIAKGKVDVTFFLSHVDGTNNALTAEADPYGINLNPGDIQIGTISGKNVTIPAGKSLVLTGAIQVPTELLQKQGDLYRVIARVQPSQGADLGELNTLDNLTYDSSTHRVYNIFGSFTAQNSNTGKDFVRKNVTLSYTDANDQLVKASLKGSGIGQLHLTTDGTVELLDVDYTDTNSLLTVSTNSGTHTALRNINVKTPIGTVAMGNVDISGDVVLNGGVKSLALGNLADSAGNSHQISIAALNAAPTFKTNIRFGNVTDYTLLSNMPIATLAVEDWNDQNASGEAIVAPAMTVFSSQLNLEADMAITNQVKVQSFTVAGTLTGARIDIFGDVGAVKLGGMHDSAFLVGSRPNGENRAAILDSFTIRGAANAPDLMANSIVISQQIGTVNIQSVDSDSGVDTTGAPRQFGIVAEAIKSYNRGTVHETNLTREEGETESLFDQQGTYVVRLV